MQIAAALLLASAAAAQAPPTRAFYVNPATGDDSAGDGQSAATAFRTIDRALRDIPSVVDANWTIVLAAGVYPESVQLRRFLMPSFVSNGQLRNEPMHRSISLGRCLAWWLERTDLLAPPRFTGDLPLELPRSD